MPAAHEHGLAFVHVTTIGIASAPASAAGVVPSLVPAGASCTPPPPPPPPVVLSPHATLAKIITTR
jgi:hypothetical protein